MQNEAQAQSQQVNVAIYPQLCGSWSHEEWPEDALVYQHGSFVDLCAGLHIEDAGEIENREVKIKRIYGRVEE